MAIKRGWLIFLILIILAVIIFQLRSLGWVTEVNTTSNVSVNPSNSAPVIVNLNSSIFTCERNVLYNAFNATDVNGDALTGSIAPQNPFFVFWITQYAPSTTESAIVSGTLDKGDVGGVNQTSKLYQETVTISDGTASTNQAVNITVIEINNAPVIEDIGVQTIWTQGSNSTFYKAWSVNDTEYILGYGNLNYNISILNSTGSNVTLFSISSTGVMNFTADSSTTIGVYNITVCVNDTGLTNPHTNISSVCGQTGVAFVKCDNFTLTVTNKNRAPNITAYYPTTLNFSTTGTTLLGFNITKNDPDGTIPDASWYVDGVLNEIDSGSSVDSFAYNFGCGISGNHTVSVTITDGLLTAALKWNITVEFVECGLPITGGGGGGGGGKGIAVFTVVPEFITTTIFQQEGKSFNIQVNNTGTAVLNFETEIINLTDMAILSDENFSLGTDQKKDLRLYLYSLSEAAPGVYFGSIIFRAGGYQKKISIVIEVKEKEPLFDIKVTVPPEYKVVKADEDVKALIDMLNVGLYGEAVDVDLYLSIVSFDKVLIFERQREVIAVETNVSVERTLHVPFDTLSGTYLVFGEAKYTNITATTFDTFRVQGKRFVRTSYTLIIILLIILIIFILFILYRRKKRREEERRR